ncbi:proton-conducting transporter membrane subunit [Pelagicoccus sp. SDUM812003]|uniref:proton-conducting transporter transmembrane domain-containing protein n=1 Tax=Pelagicoccus sp. SDUM812003 TaxID=3041267 RepID=UPI0028101D7D|nr:proton-conducting transporter membrane subunit [Pelagicoccus sp. SDUM812003]MDQ8204221.1 proton-conducting transporter membrane subunit [Pelagicoccus sp. SDUM812003]
MDNILFIGASFSTISLLIWLLASSARLNANPLRAASLGERHGWLAFALTLLAGAAWLVAGREGVLLSVTRDQWIGLRFDALSIPLALLITFLAAIILRFSKHYLAGEPDHGRFTKWMCATFGSVIALVMAPGLAQFLVAWIATSLCLHQLLVFYPARRGTRYSARKKFLVSRISDLLLAIAFSGTYFAFGSQSFEQIFYSLRAEETVLPSYIPWLIAAAAILKSVQFPFHTWLPETMGTPTPVSALMHAGIVNAGGILIITFAPFYQFSDTSAPLHLLALSGAITAAFGSLVMLSQTSVKRSLAYSTVAQMGFMLMQCGLGAFHLALLHIVAHSLYKAHSFLSSGSSVRAIETRSAPANTEPRTPLKLVAAAAAGFLLSLGLFVALSGGFDSKPGAYVFAAVLAAALIQLLYQSPTQRPANGFLSAAAIGSAYLLLTNFAAWWVAPEISVHTLTSSVFDATLAGIIFCVFIFTILLQNLSKAARPDSWVSKLYVHAFNGFYLNTIADRTIRFLRLHPDQA